MFNFNSKQVSKWARCITDCLSISSGRHYLFYLFIYLLTDVYNVTLQLDNKAQTNEH